MKKFPGDIRSKIQSLNGYVRDVEGFLHICRWLVEERDFKSLRLSSADFKTYLVNALKTATIIHLYSIYDVCKEQETLEKLVNTISSTSTENLYVNKEKFAEFKKNAKLYLKKIEDIRKRIQNTRDKVFAHHELTHVKKDKTINFDHVGEFLATAQSILKDAADSIDYNCRI